MAINVKDLIIDGFLELCFEKDIKHLTIKDILNKTGVSRQTFYNHFLDKNDIIQYIYNNRIIINFNSSDKVFDFYHSLIESFNNMKKYKVFLKQACLLSDQNCLKDYIFNHCETFDLKWHQQLYGNKPMPEALRFATIYHANASSSMTLSWILSDMQIPVEEICRLIVEMRGLGMKELFKDGDYKDNPYKIDK